MAAVRLFLFLFLFTLSLFLTLTFSLSENEALLKLKESFGHSNALNSWVPTSHNACVDKWVGVICMNGVVASLNLKGMALSGIIDIDALNEIPGLRSISFGNNSFSGPIPEFNKLGALKALYLSRNQFTGEIPDDYFSSMASLKKLWLDNNKFTGEIPDSIMKLSHLIEVHLEGNHFSGPIPELKQPSPVTSLDVSYNNLEGEIPHSLSKFGVDAFKGNDRLCGNPLKLCTKLGQPSPPKAASTSQEQSKPPSGNNDSKLLIAVVVIALLIFFIVVAVFYAKRKERNYFRMLEKDSNVDSKVVEVHVPESNNNNKVNSSSRKSETSLRMKSSKNGRTSGLGDLVMINDEKGSFDLADLMKAAAEVLGNGSLGSAYKAAMANGLTVVVKRLREINKMGRDTFDSEMKRLGRIRHPNILTPLAYHYRREEKLVVSEHMPKGSLLYLLHGDRGISHAQLNWPNRLKIIKGMVNGMVFIHSEFASYELPHGNLKSSNVLLNNKYEPLITDYAFHPLTNPNHAVQSMFAYQSPEYSQNQKVSKKSDVYCLGIVILEVMTGKFPSQYLSNVKGGIDVVQWVGRTLSEGRDMKELIDPDIRGSGNADPVVMNMMVKLLQIGVDCAQSEAEQRMDIWEVMKRIEQLQNN